MNDSCSRSSMHTRFRCASRWPGPQMKTTASLPSGSTFKSGGISRAMTTPQSMVPLMISPQISGRSPRRTTISAPACWRLNRLRIGGRTWLPMVMLEPTTTRPACACLRSSIPLRAKDSVRSTLRAHLYTTWPASVGTVRRLRRSRSWTPKCRSTACTCILTAGWVMINCSAAALKLSHPTTAQKTSRWRRFTIRSVAGVARPQIGRDHSIGARFALHVHRIDRSRANRLRLLRCFVNCVRAFANCHSGNAKAIQLGDGEGAITNIDRVPNGRPAAKATEEEPADGIVLGLTEIDSQLSLHVAKQHQAIHHRGAIGQPFHRRAGKLGLVADLDGKAVHDVSKRHKPGGRSVLIDHDRLVAPVAFHLRK